jgi:hypothetical protein
MGLAIGGAASLGGSLMSSMTQSNAASQASSNYQSWLNMMKPTPAQQQAYREQGTSYIDADFLGSNKQLTSNLASRGLGGGQLASGLSDNTRAKEQALGNLDTQVTLIGAGVAPSTPPPVAMNTGSYFMGNLGNMSQYMGGMGLANSFMGLGNSSSGYNTGPTASGTDMDYGSGYYYY